MQSASLELIYLNKFLYDEDFLSLQHRFELQNFITLPGFVGPTILNQLEVAAESPQVVVPESWKQLSDRYDMGVDRPMLCSVFFKLFNEPSVHLFFKKLTGIENLNFITAFQYTVDARSKVRTMSWHDDTSLTRVFGMSIRVSRDNYAGGELCIRKKGSSEFSSVSLNNVGDAVLFKIGSEFEHAVSPVIGEGARKNIIVFGHLTRPEGLSLNVY